MITIIASFDEADTAAMAASTIGAVAQGMMITSSMTSTGTAMAALGRPRAENDQWGSHLVQVHCPRDRESAVVEQLASLGARKISVSSGS